MARATSSLPVPRSPVTSTLAVALRGARDLLAQDRHRAALADELAELPRLPCGAPRLSASARTRRSVFSTTSSSRSVESGFSRKSSAPSRVARTAASIVAWPLIMTTGMSLPLARNRSSS